MLSDPSLLSHGEVRVVAQRPCRLSSWCVSTNRCSGAPLTPSPASYPLDPSYTIALLFERLCVLLGWCRHEQETAGLLLRLIVRVFEGAV